MTISNENNSSESSTYLKCRPSASSLSSFIFAGSQSRLPAQTAFTAYWMTMSIPNGPLVTLRRRPFTRRSSPKSASIRRLKTGHWSSGSLDSGMLVNTVAIRPSSVAGGTLEGKADTRAFKCPIWSSTIICADDTDMMNSLRVWKNLKVWSQRPRSWSTTYKLQPLPLLLRM